MKIAWLQPLFRHEGTRPARPGSAAKGRWSWGFLRARRRCAPSLPASPQAGVPVPAVQRASLTLGHHVDVSHASHELARQLGCDGWHVVCQHEHQQVVQFTRDGSARYCVAFDCTPPVEKAVYHGSRAWALTIIPQHGEDNLPSTRVAEVKSALAGLHG